MPARCARQSHRGWGRGFSGSSTHPLVLVYGCQVPETKHRTTFAEGPKAPGSRYPVPITRYPRVGTHGLPQGAFSFARKAFIPACPSALTRRVAMVSIV